MNIIKLCIQRPRMLWMIVLAFAIFGAISYLSLPVALMPKTELPFVSVSVVYPGASPKEIETLVIKPIENAVSTISGIKQLTSSSQENFGYVFLEFEADVDVNIAKQEVKDKVDAILNNLPTDSKRPIVQAFKVGSQAVVEFALTGPKSSRELYEYADKNLRDRFSQVPGVAEVEISGGQAREIHIKIDRKILESYGISLMQLVGFIGAQNVDIPGGYIQKGFSEYNIRLTGKFTSLEDLRNVQLPTRYGLTRLGDIVKITDSEELARKKARFVSKENADRTDLSTVLIGIRKTEDANEVETAEGAKKIAESIRKELPAGIALYNSSDTSLFTRGALDDTRDNIIMGIVLTAIILLLFLHDWRSTFIVSLSMPVSIIATFIFIKASGFSLNMMTLMGISISVGILVTNSIVVIENIYRHAIMGKSIYDAAYEGSTEIAIAVSATTLTNVVVFLPLASMSSIVGQIMRPFGITVTYATLVSLVTAFTLTPMLAAHLLKTERIKQLEDITKLSGIGRFLEKYMLSLERAYRKLLAFVLGKKSHQVMTIVFTIIAFFASLMLFPFIGGEFIPQLDTGDVLVMVEMPTNYNLDRTSAVTEVIEKRLQKMDGVETISILVGSDGSSEQAQNLARIQVKLVDNEKRDFSSESFVTKLRRELADLPDAKLAISVSSSMGGGPGDQIEISVLGMEQAKVVEIAKELETRTKKIPGAANIDLDYSEGKPEVRVVPDRVRMAAAGVTSSQMAMELRTGIDGTVASKYREGGYEYDIKVKLDDADKSSPDMIGQLPISTPSGLMRLEQLAQIEYSTSPTTIRRVNKFNTVTMSCGTEGRTTGEVLADINKEIANMNLPVGYTTKLGGRAERMNESNSSLLGVFLLAIILTYMLLVALLESFVQPLIIFFTIPLSIIGVLLSLFIAGQSINIMSIMAIIMLVGIVVNNAILLIDYTNVKIAEGMPIIEALIEACSVKLKPIIMSTLAIALGMLPLAMGQGSYGVEMRQSMGIVTIGGLIVSAFFTMLVIPVLYKWMTRARKVYQ